MSVHSYSRCWLHLTWATLKRERLLPKPPAAKVSEYLHNYAKEKGIYMKINFVNPDHTHALIDLPTRYSIEEVMKLLKGGSSHWINANRIIPGKFAWGRGYGAFSVSHSNVGSVAGTSPTRRPIIARRPLLRSLRHLCGLTAWNGTMMDGMRADEMT